MLESMSILHRWSPELKFEIARMHLKGAAKEWYLSNARQIKSWDDFVVRFKAAFIREKSSTVEWEEMPRRRQREGKDVSKYYFNKVRLCKEVRLSDDEIRDQVALGL